MDASEGWAQRCGAHGTWTRTDVPKGYDPDAHLSKASVLVIERGDWRLMRSTLAMGYYATHPDHGWYLLSATDDVSAMEEFVRHVEGRA